jgi:hypothetical protein
MGDRLRVQLSEEGADAERLDTLTGYLRGELLQLDVGDGRPAGRCARAGRWTRPRLEGCWSLSVIPLTACGRW